MPATSGDNLRYPLLSDTPNVPRDLQYLADDVQAALNKRLGGGSAVAVQVESLPSITVPNGTNSFQVFTGEGTLGVAFVAAPSGRALVCNEARIQANVAGPVGDGIALGTEIRNGAVVGSGTVHRAAALDEAVQVGGPGTSDGGTAGFRLSVRLSTTFLVTTLTPGASYNIRWNVFNNTIADASMVRRRIVVIPI